MNWTWLTGRITRKELIEEHPLEYEKLFGETAEDGQQ
jgi:hypothetical protein